MSLKIHNFFADAERASCVVIGSAAFAVATCFFPSLLAIVFMK